jgi:hypothetical protein
VANAGLLLSNAVDSMVVRLSAGIISVGSVAASGWWVPVADGHSGYAVRGFADSLKNGPKSRIQGWLLVRLAQVLIAKRRSFSRA